MKKRIGPPGWQPHVVTSRLDGFVSADGRVPAFIIDMIASSKSRGGGRSIAAIRARMLARQRICERMSNRSCKEHNRD